jgi:hypothetical protein
MKPGAGLLLLVAAFCLYGFIAAGEPGRNHIYFRVGYAIIGIASLVAGLWMLSGPSKKSP